MLKRLSFTLSFVLLLASAASAYVSTGTGTALLMHFNEGDGQNVYDESGNGNNGTRGVNNTAEGARDPTWITPAATGGCRFGNCMDFAPGNVVRVPSSTSLNITGDLTVEAWVSPASNTNNRNRTIVSKWSTTGVARQQYRLRMVDPNGATANQANNIEFCVGNGTTTVCALTASATGPLNTTNQLYHVAGTYTSSTRQVAVWVNGVRQATATAGVGFTITTTNTDLLIGSNYTDNANPPVTLDSNNNSWDGNIDEVRIRSTVPDTTISTTPVFNPGVVINGVTHTPSAGSESWTIYNANPQTITMTGWVFQQCSTTNNYIPPAGLTIATGVTKTIVVGAGTDETPANTWYTANGTGAADISSLAASDCLRAYGQNTIAANTIIDFVAWGADAGTGDDQAVTAGLWKSGTYVSTVPSLNQQSIALFTTEVATETKIGDNEEGVLDWARSPYITIKGENSPRASGDWYSANLAGAGGTRNIPYDYSIEVPSGSTTLHVEIWDADVGNDGGAGEATANRDRTTGTFDTNTVYSLINPSGTTVATFTGDPTNGTDNTFMTPDGFRVSSPATGTWTLRADATQQTGTGADINRFLPRAEGYQIQTKYTQLGSNGPALALNYLMYPWVTSGCSFNVYDFDSDTANTTTQQINLQNVYGATTFNWTIPDASLSGNDVWAANNNLTTAAQSFTNDQSQTDYGPYSLVGNVVGYNAGGANGNYIPVEMRNFNGGALADAGDGDTDANMILMYLPTDNGGPPLVPFIVQRLNYVSGTNPPSTGNTTRVEVFVELINPTGTALTSPSITSFVPASVGGNVTYAFVAGSLSVTQGTTSGPTAGTITWTPGTIAAGTSFIRMRYRIDVTPISAGRKAVTGTPAANGTQATYTPAHSSGVADTRTVGPICELALSTGTTLTATAVEMTELSATPYNDAALVEWRTGSELNNLGFNVYRSTSADGNYVQINGSLILGLLTSAAGGNYYFVDQDVVAGQTYYYLVEDIDLNGQAKKHGPVSATIDAGLPSFASSSFNPTLYTGGGWFSGETGSGGTTGTPPTPVPPVDIEQSGDDIIITLYPEAPMLTYVNHGGQDYEQLSVTGYVSTGTACHPQIPERTLLVNLPERDASFTLETFETASLALASGEKVFPQPQYQMNAGGTALEPVFCEDASAYIDPTPASLDETVKWLGTSWSGGHHMASIRVHPVTYSPNDETLTYATRIVVRLHLGAAVTAPPTQPLLADDLARHFTIFSTPGAVKIRTSGTGLVQLDRAALSAAGFAVNSDVRNWQMYYHGREQAIVVTGDGDATLGSDEKIVFLAQANADAQAETDNAYWLIPGARAGLRMASIDATPTAATLAENYFWSEDTAEQNHIYYSSFIDNADADRWFWQYAVAPAAPTFPITVTGLHSAVGSDAQLTVHLRGVTSYTAQDPDHHARVSVNGHLAGDFTFDGQNELVATVSVPLAWLNEGGNALQVELPNDLPVAYDAMYINKFSLVYPRQFSAAANGLSFSTELYGNHLVDGFSTDDVMIVDVTDDFEAPNVLGNIEIGGTPGNYSARFLSPDHAFGGDFIGAAISSLPLPESMSAVTASNLRDSRNQGSYLIITPPDFLASVQALASYRQSRGHVVKIATTDDIYNEFGFGVQSPTALQTFLRYAHSHWSTPPKYVLLVGDGTYDPKGYLGPVSGNTNFMPVPLVQTSFMQAGSDSWYALMDDHDAVPDLILGRLPVGTSAQLDRIIGRMIAYESTPDSATWERKITIVEDNVEAGHEETDDHFAQTVAAIEAKIPANYTQQLVSQDSLGGVAQARQALVDDINAGTLVVNYVGHGSIQLWASELLFQNSSVATLNNTNLPVVVAMNCLNNYFFFPGFTSLSETMLEAETGGAIGYWSSTGLSTPQWQELLNVGFYDALFGNTHALAATAGSPITLGSAVHTATLTLTGHPEANDVLQTFAILGDPALELKIPVQAITPTDPGGGTSGGGSSAGADSSSSAAGCSNLNGADDFGDAALLVILFMPLAMLAALRWRTKKIH